MTGVAELITELVVTPSVRGSNVLRHLDEIPEMIEREFRVSAVPISTVNR